MNSRFGLVLGVTLAIVKLAFASTMEHGAFLNKPVFSTKELIAQLDTDPIVAKRFERHFMMDKADIRKVFASLVLKPLPVTRKYEVYNVDKNFKVGKKILTFKKGTLAFVNEAGKPILKRSCGNPMAVLPPIGVTAESIQEPRPVELASTEAPMVFATIVEPELNILETAIVPELPAIETVAPAEAVEPLQPEPPAAPITPVLAPAALSPWLGPLGLPILAVNPRSGGGSAPPPVPEPASLLVLAGGAAFVARRRK
jgi:hypothetical protein